MGEEKINSLAGLIWETGGDSRSPYPKPHSSLQKAGEQEEEEEEVEEKKPDPPHQLVLHFSRTALTEKR